MKKMLGSTALSLLIAACGSDDGVEQGTVSVLLEAEDVIVNGIEAGEAVDNIRDGWTATFDKYIATVGDIDLHYATDEHEQAAAHEAFVVDLTKLPGSGLPLWELSGLRAGRWEFSYATPGAAHGGIRHESVSDADFQQMVAQDFTYWVEGQISNPAGLSCPPAALAAPGNEIAIDRNSGGDSCYEAPTVRFAFGAAAETVFGPCEIDGVPGLSVAADATTTVAATIHGDHLFFNGFPEGSEGGVTRLAQWLADCDLNLDGLVTAEELKAIAPSALAALDERYQLGGSPITPLTTIYDYVQSQLKTQGHFQGEGECPFDGETDDHGH